MDELSRSWGKLTQSVKENVGIVLPKVSRVNDFILAAKFYTAVGRTLKLLWWVCDGMRIRSQNDHKVIYVPRSYDKSGLEEDKGGGLGKNAENAEGETSVHAASVEVTVPMEDEECGKGINADVSVKFMAGLNSQLQSDNGPKVNVGEFFLRTLTSPQINITAGLRNNEHDLRNLMAGN